MDGSSCVIKMNCTYGTPCSFSEESFPIPEGKCKGCFALRFSMEDMKLLYRSMLNYYTLTGGTYVFRTISIGTPGYKTRTGQRYLLLIDAC